MRERADEIVAELLDRIAGTDRPVDLMETVTGRFPLDVMGHILGIPEEDRASVRRWTRHLFSTRPEHAERTLAAKKGLGGFAAGLGGGAP